MRRFFSLALLVAVSAVNAAAQTAASEFSDSPIRVFGFGHIGYLSEDDGEGGFVIGQAVGHLSAALSDRINLFSEATASGKDDQYKVELERIFIRYEHSDALKFSLGRYHTPIGYWNTAYHHGSWLHTSTSRPEVIKFGSQVIPVHFVGVLVEGSVPTDAWNFGYQAALGNGRHSNIARAGDAGDINSDRAWLLGFTASPLDSALKLGASIYSDRVSPSFGNDVDELIVSAYAVWDGRTIEAFAEYHHLDHESDVGAMDDTSSGYYLQVGYKGFTEQPITPYARIEEVDIGDEDPLLFGRGLNYDAQVLGLRYELAETVALKAEYRRQEFDDSGDHENNFFLEISFVVSGE